MKPINDPSMRAAPQSQHSKGTATSSQRLKAPGRAIRTTSAETNHDDSPDNSIREKRLPLVIHLPLLILQTLHTVFVALLAKFLPSAVHTTTHSTLEQYDNEEVYRNENCTLPELPVLASPALTTLLDTALYHANEAELVPTTCAASRLLQQFLEMKEASATVLRECRWMVGVPFVPLELDEHDVAGGSAGVVLENGRVVSGGRDDVTDCGSVGGWDGVSEDAKWNEFDTVQDFASQCFSAAKEAIHRLTTDRLADSANLTLQDSISSMGEDGKKDEVDHHGVHNSKTHLQQQPIPSCDLTSAELERCYRSQPRSTCWESPRLYCPDYSWADDCITGCQRLLRNLSKHKFISLVGAHGWTRYTASSSSFDCDAHVVHPPTYASCTPHPFPSLEAVHALKYLASDLLSNTIPSHLNQFRAAVEANAVVSKRIYLVKCEYRAPIRAHMESWMALKAAPKLEVVERYLREFHGVAGDVRNTGVEGIATKSSTHGTIRRKSSSTTSSDTVSSLQKHRDSLEKLISEYWKHPSFLEALQLERLCERLEMEMSQILLPLSHLATEIMDKWKGRLRAVAVITSELEDDDLEDNSDDDEESVELIIEEILGWREVPHMRELLKCLKSILCRKPGPDESSGIRPLLLDLQGVPRKNDDLMDLSVEVPFYQPPPKNNLPFHCLSSLIHNPSQDSAVDPWYYLEHFIQRIETLLKLVDRPDSPLVIADDRGIGRWQELVDDCIKAWDSDLFRAQYQDWYDMVTRQRGLNAGTDASSLLQISENIREAEIELSIAMASKGQLELVRQRLEALTIDKMARYFVLAQIVNDVALRELNENIIVLPTPKDMTSDFPELTALGLFGTQMILSKEVLPIG
eukprot:CCRYP_016538-RA/>CCRYP_016538-RA protein AED:0.02 eAED:0.02 QI:160/1/1/1/1/1/2/172/862